MFVVSTYSIIFIATLTFISSESFHLIVFTEQELGDLKSSNLKSFRDIQVDDSNILSWTGLIIPVKKQCFNNFFKYDLHYMCYLCYYRKIHRTQKVHSVLRLTFLPNIPSNRRKFVLKPKSIILTLMKKVKCVCQ